MTILAKPVHHGENDGLPANFRESFDEVQSNVGPYRRRHWKRQEEPRRVKLLRLEPLTDSAGADEILHVVAHPGEMKVTPESM